MSYEEWLLIKDNSTKIEQHGKNIVNFMENIGNIRFHSNS